MTTVEVEGGICGFISVIDVSRLSDLCIVRLTSGCSMVMACTQDLEKVTWKDALNPRSEDWLYRVMFRHIRHCGCLVPAAVAKAIEVEIGAALPGNAHLKFRTPATCCDSGP